MSQNRDEAGDERTVRELDRAWNQVYLQNDRQPFGRILADDFRGAFPDGRTIGKADLMQPGEGRPVEFSEFAIEMFGPTAITRGRIRVEHPEGPAEQRFVRVYSRRDNQWQAVAAYVFPVNTK